MIIEKANKCYNTSCNLSNYGGPSEASSLLQNFWLVNINKNEVAWHT